MTMRVLCCPATRAIGFLLVVVVMAMSDFRVGAFSGQPQSSKNPVKVLVTGAAGKTGRIVLSKLEQDHRYEPKGLFRTEQSARNIVKIDASCHLEHVVVADITSSTFLQDLSEGHSSNDSSFLSSDRKANNIDANRKDAQKNGLENIEAMIICTSAVPRIRKRSLASMLVKAPWRALRGEPVMDIHSMRFGWKHGGYPEKVDYRGQIAQIDLAKKLGIPHVVLVSAMGGTDPDNFVNSVGKTPTSNNNNNKKSKDKPHQEGHGDILLWKRRAEKYLVESGLDYTILHPGHLVDTPGGMEEFVFGVDDELYELNTNNHHHRDPNDDKNITSSANTRGAMTRISREDVAELCVAALSAGKGKKISFDCITMSPSEISSSPPPQQKPEPKPRRKRLFARSAVAESSSPRTTKVSATETEERISIEPETMGGRKPAEEVLIDFLHLSKTTNYDLHP